jgi:hypothetical protein
MNLYEKIKEAIPNANVELSTVTDRKDLPFVTINDSGSYGVFVSSLPDTYAEWVEELESIKGDLQCAMVAYDGESSDEQECFEETKALGGSVLLLVQEI